MVIGGIYLAVIFAITAMLYASIGFGGGSTYIAVLALVKTPYEAIPIIALLCNIIVVTGGSLRFSMHKIIPWGRVYPILLFSTPAAWLGGLTPISYNIFMLLLGGLLILSSGLIFLRHIDNEEQINGEKNIIFSAILGAIIGYVSGLVGIGGGIFLAPILLIMQWGRAREIAATASLFILLNSIAGLIGQLSKYQGQFWDDIITLYYPLFIAVCIGGQIGSLLAVKILPEKTIKILTALLTLYVGIRIFFLS